MLIKDKLIRGSACVCSSKDKKRHPENEDAGSLGGLAVWCLPSTRGVILESWDRVPPQAPCMEPARVSVSLSLF